MELSVGRRIAEFRIIKNEGRFENRTLFVHGENIPKKVEVSLFSYKCSPAVSEGEVQD